MALPSNKKVQLKIWKEKDHNSINLAESKGRNSEPSAESKGHKSDLWAKSNGAQTKYDLLIPKNQRCDLLIPLNLSSSDLFPFMSSIVFISEHQFNPVMFNLASLPVEMITIPSGGENCSMRLRRRARSESRWRSVGDETRRREREEEREADTRTIPG